MMIEVYDKNLKKIGVLENAHNIQTDERKNTIGYLSFSLPFVDTKNSYCNPFCFVRYKKRYYRIMPAKVTRSASSIAIKSYVCENAIATLMDRVLYGCHIIGNKGVYTEEVLRYILSKQERWVFGRCDFHRQFEYNFEQESLLGAMLSVAKPFAEDYLWEFGTEEEPFTINLIRPSLKVKHIFMSGKNIIESITESEPTQICTRIYPLGYGEGINQLDIKSVNGGLPYIQSPKEVVEKYGIIEKVWIDRRYESSETLLEAAKSILNDLQEPRISYRITAFEGEEVKIGDRVRLIDQDIGLDTRINVTEIRRNEQEKRIVFIVSNKHSSIAKAVADLADRQRIETTYAQGATQLYAQSLQANASSRDGAELHFFIPREMRVINKVLLKVRKEAFRSYSKATGGGGGISTSTQEGGGSYISTESGGGDYISTESGGEVSTSTENGGGSYASLITGVDNYIQGSRTGHNHGIPDGTTFVDKDGSWVIFEQSGDHTHEGEVNLPDHTHDIEIPDHSHSLNIPSHSHSIEVPNHSHKVEIKNHTHTIEPGIYRFSEADHFDLFVNGKYIRSFERDTEELDITKDLCDDKRVIPRNKWHKIKIVPAGLAYICMDLYMQGFVQSRGDKTV